MGIFFLDGQCSVHIDRLWALQIPFGFVLPNYVGTSTRRLTITHHSQTFFRNFVIPLVFVYISVHNFFRDVFQQTVVSLFLKHFHFCLNDIETETWFVLTSSIYLEVYSPFIERWWVKKKSAQKNDIIRSYTLLWVSKYDLFLLYLKSRNIRFIFR